MRRVELRSADVGDILEGRHPLRRDEQLARKGEN